MIVSIDGCVSCHDVFLLEEGEEGSAVLCYCSARPSCCSIGGETKTFVVMVVAVV